MKYILTLITAFVFVNIGLSQRGQNHSQFSRKAQVYQAILNEGNRKVQYNKAMDFVARYSVTTEELISIGALFQKENKRYLLCYKAYPKILDKQNFFSVYDLFTQFSFAMKLYHHTQGGSGYSPIDDPAHIDTVVVVVEGDEELAPYRNIIWPDASKYNGFISGDCSNPMSDRDFEIHFMRKPRFRNEQERINYLTELVVGNCLSTAQIMKLGLEIRLEKDRLGFLKKGYKHCFDIENYLRSAQIIEHKYYKDDLLGYIKQTQAIPIVIEPSCIVPDKDFNFMITSIENRRFSNEKMEIAKKQVARECFSILQLRAIVSLFSFESDKLELLKYIVDNTRFKNELYGLKDVLHFDSSVREYNDYILRKR